MSSTVPRQGYPIPSFSRLAILRWLIDTEADMPFRLRPHVTRFAPRRCGCGVHSSIYPDGFAAGSVAESHLHFPTTWVRHCQDFDNSSFDRFIDSSHHPPLWNRRDDYQFFMGLPLLHITQFQKVLHSELFHSLHQSLSAFLRFKISSRARLTAPFNINYAVAAVLAHLPFE